MRSEKRAKEKLMSATSRLQAVYNEYDRGQITSDQFYGRIEKVRVTIQD